MSDFKSDIHDCEGMQFWRDQCAKVDAALREEHARLTDTERQLREAQERCERLENVGRLLQEWVDGIVADFDGVTDDANDPQRLHTWDDLERCERRLPISMPPSPNPTK